MRLKRLKLHGFASFARGLDVRFAERGTTVVLGCNEAGKSTLLRAFPAILFGLRDFAQIRRYRPWERHDRYGGELELTTDDGRHLVFSRDFATQRTEVHECLANGRRKRLYRGYATPRADSDDTRAYDELLRSLVVIQDEALFRNTVFLGQQGLQSSMSEELRRLLSGTSEADYQSVLAALQTRLGALTGTCENGTHSTLDAGVRERQMRLAEARTILERSEEAERSLARLGASVAELTERIECSERERRGHERLLEVLEGSNGLRIRHTELESRHARLTRLRERLADLELDVRRRFSHFRGAPANTDTLLRRHLAASDELRVARADVAARLREYERSVSARSTTYEDLAAAGCLVLGLVVGMGTSMPTAWGLLGGSALGLVIAGLGRLQRLGSRRQQEILLASVEAAELRQQGCEAQLENLADQLGRIVSDRSAERALETKSELEKLLQERREINARLDTLEEDGVSDAALVRSLASVTKLDSEIERIERAHPELGGRREPEELEATLLELRAREARLRQERDRERRAHEDARIEAATLAARTHFDIVRLEDELRSSENELEDSALEVAALGEAIGELGAAVRDFEEKDVHDLARETSQLFGRITEGRYSRVHLGASCRPLVSGRRGEAISPEDLSQGTQDQLYFTLRVAMARQLARSVRLPLFLDDPFVNFDADRLATTRKLLEDLHEHQAILVSCDRSYASWPGSVVDLDAIRASGTGAGPSPSPKERSADA